MSLFGLFFKELFANVKTCEKIKSKSCLQKILRSNSLNATTCVSSQ